MKKIINALVNQYLTNTNINTNSKTDLSEAKIKAVIYILACCDPTKFTKMQLDHIENLGIPLPNKMNWTDTKNAKNMILLQNLFSFQQSNIDQDMTEKRAREIRRRLNFGKNISQIQAAKQPFSQWAFENNKDNNINAKDCVTYFSDIKILLEYMADGFSNESVAREVLNQLKIEDDPKTLSSSARTTKTLLDNCTDEYAKTKGVLSKGVKAAMDGGVLFTGASGALLGFIFGGPIGAVIGGIVGIAIGWLMTKSMAEYERSKAAFWSYGFKDKLYPAHFLFAGKKQGPISTTMENLRNDCDVTLNK